MFIREIFPGCFAGAFVIDLPGSTYSLIHRTEAPAFYYPGFAFSENMLYTLIYSIFTFTIKYFTFLLFPKYTIVPAPVDDVKIVSALIPSPLIKRCFSLNLYSYFSKRNEIKAVDFLK